MTTNRRLGETPISAALDGKVELPSGVELMMLLGHGRMRETVGLPGTGLSWYEQQRVGVRWNVLPWLLVGAVVAFLLFGR